MNGTNVWNLQDLITTSQTVSYGGFPDGWYPARPYGETSYWYRLKAAWLVFTGKADAVVWTGGQ